MIEEILKEVLFMQSKRLWLDIEGSEEGYNSQENITLKKRGSNTLYKHKSGFHFQLLEGMR